MSGSKRRRARNLFTPEEDEIIKRCVETNRQATWVMMARNLPGRTARQIRERWLNYLCPDVSKEPWSSQEDTLLLRTVSEIGQSWSSVAKALSGRTDVMVKNRYKLLKRRETSWMREIQRQSVMERRSMTHRQVESHVDDVQEQVDSVIARAIETIGQDPVTWKLPVWDSYQMPPLKERK